MSDRTPDLIDAANAAPVRDAHPDTELGAIARALAAQPGQALTLANLNAQKDALNAELAQARRDEYWAAKFGGTVPAWWHALQAAIEADPRSKAGVAERLGVSRPYVSRVVNFHMKAPEAFAERVRAVYMQVACPHLGQTISPAQCRAYAGRAYGALTQFDVEHWRACQRCTARAPLAPVPDQPATPDTAIEGNAP